MPLSSLAGCYYKSTLARYEQGDILRDVSLVQWAEKVGDEIVVHERDLSYCVVLSQECDLEHDFNSRNDAARKDNDKFLQSILLCPAYPATLAREGKHLEGLGQTMQRHNTDQWKRLKANQLSRYHFLQGQDDLQVPDMMLDFKHYFAVPCDVLYRGEFGTKYLASLEIVFRDNLSGRFAHYLSRIGLPEPTEVVA